MKKLSVLAALAALLVAVAVSSGSSHREAPKRITDPTGDWTDTYFFTPADDPGSAVAIGNVIPFEDPGGGPNFYDFDETAHYYLNFDNTGDGVYDIRYLFEFKRHEKKGNRLPLAAGGPVNNIRDLLVFQTYNLSREDLRTASCGARNVSRATCSWRRATSARRRCRTTTRSSGRPPSRCRAAARCSPASATIRSTSTSAGRSTWSTWAASARATPAAAATRSRATPPLDRAEAARAAADP